MVSTTTNYGLQVPTDGGDKDKWGQYLNTSLIALDGILKTLQDQIDAHRIPIGGLHMNTTGDDPATQLGYGTWEAYASGRALVGVGSNGQSAWAAGDERGSEAHTLTEAEMPSHTHSISQSPHSHGVSDPGHVHGGTADGSAGFVKRYPLGGGGEGFAGGVGRINTNPGTDAALTGISLTAANANVSNNNTGGGGAHNNLQPSIAVHVWRRTA